MRVTALSLTDFRCYETAELSFPAGVTVVVGGNGAGKTTLLEAIGWAALGKSLRGVHDSALVRSGAEQAILRADISWGDRRRLVEAEVRPVGRNRVLVDHHALVRTRDLLDALRVTVFAPDDLVLVKGSPGGRRGYLDDLLVAITPRFHGVRADYEKVVRHRNALLKGGVRDAEARATLDVFDAQLVAAGTELATGRLELINRLLPRIDAAYRALARDDRSVTGLYEAEWAGDAAPDPAKVADQLTAALASQRGRELDRGLTLVGPHRDEWRLEIGGLDARTHASQGEQRTLSLALRLGGHRLAGEVLDEEPVLLLDDVFSELDPDRGDALVAELPVGQTVLTTAGAVPAAVHPEQLVRVAGGKVIPA